MLSYDAKVNKKHMSTAAPGRTDPENGTDRWLSEIRHVFRNRKDVIETFGPYSVDNRYVDSTL